ncbi:MAG: 50S ribosomal protein L17 [Planctomycetota bacterium]|jgi:large subunit ribosomal protein L17|nr:50S ribosomal protein L17 [Planctomycetota bacterium]RLS66788.1 MAG: 50S ribosomal protein L17 [Planctomycetota bacterium]RLS98265.1 MAG: 50S ribosomal protein L17 [Planctomycetota bacterium]
MRHLRKGRVLGRSPSHRKALFSNLASAIFLTEREYGELEANKPKVPGRIITTIEKAKEIRPIVEKCITIAKKGLAAEAAAEQFATTAERGTDAWKAWRKSDAWQKWCDARSPGVTARRRVLSMIKDKTAVRVLFEKVAPKFTDRNGGYTRILRLAKPRVGDAGTRAILEFVGKNDRVKEKAQKPSFGE